MTVLSSSDFFLSVTFTPDCRFVIISSLKTYPPLGNALTWFFWCKKNLFEDYLVRRKQLKKIILICVILVISLLFVGAAQGKKGMATLHFYLDVHDNNIFDKNEPSPPWFIICLGTEHTHLGAHANRLKFIGSSGDAIWCGVPP